MPKKKTVAPITPDEVAKKKSESIPAEVIEAFNELIAQNFNGHSACVLQKEAAALAADKLGVSTDVLYKNHWLDVEDTFRAAGWDVDYDKPGYNESYEANFKFTKEKRHRGGYF
jgi:hypothetical protein